MGSAVAGQIVDADTDIVSHEWNGQERKWIELAPESAADFSEDGEGRKIILSELHLADKQNEVVLVSVKVESFTVESKAGDYQAVRGYAQFAPENLWIHVPIYDPASLVGPEGDVDIFATVFRYVARALDAEVYGVASRRADVAAAKVDIEAKIAPRRFEAGKEVPGKKTESESL